METVTAAKSSEVCFILDGRTCQRRPAFFQHLFILNLYRGWRRAPD